MLNDHKACRRLPDLSTTNVCKVNTSYWSHIERSRWMKWLIITRQKKHSINLNTLRKWSLTVMAFLNYHQNMYHYQCHLNYHYYFITWGLLRRIDINLSTGGLRNLKEIEDWKFILLYSRKTNDSGSEKWSIQ